MNSTVINIRTQTDVKRAAQSVADDLGLSLSAIINSFLKQLVKTKSLDLNLSEKPSKYLIQALKESRKNVKDGDVSPGFSNAEDMIAYLHEKK